MAAWIITREDGQKWWGTTCAEWVDRLFRTSNRGYTFLCPREDELLVLQQYLADQDTSVEVDPVTRKDGTLLTLKCSKNKKVITFINALGVCATTQGKAVPLYVPTSRQPVPQACGTDALVSARADSRGLLDTYRDQPWARASWQVQAIDAQALPAAVPAPGCVIYALVDPRTRRVRYVGQTNHPRQRLIQHVTKTPANTLFAVRTRRTRDGQEDWVVVHDRGGPMADWLDALAASGHVPLMRIVRHAHSREEACNLEYTCAEDYRRHGVRLTNDADALRALRTRAENMADWSALLERGAAEGGEEGERQRWP
jgi:hypothetical protein